MVALRSTLPQLFLALVLVFMAHGQNLKQGVTVRLPLGEVRGVLGTLPQGQVYQFLGIPYALPPVGQRRFQKPAPIVEKWGVLDASQFGPSCPQPGRRDRTSEDCLYLNVYVPATASLSAPISSPKAVMVWIHGGGFQVGAGRDYDGGTMAAQGDVVVVTINYRQGMLGFLSTEDAASPGNYGLWDQRLALQWVHSYIAPFSGDPGKVTIFGQSGGAYSVGLHALSPLNNGLFHRAIMQSGTGICRRTIALDPSGYARRFGEQLGCLSRTGAGFDTQFLVDCARNRSVEEILQATSSAGWWPELVYRLLVAPSVDGELVPVAPRLLLDPSYGQQVPFWSIDIMVGTNNAEGGLVLGPLIPWQRQLGFNAVNGIPTRVLCSNISHSLANDYFNGSEALAQALCRQYTSTASEVDQARAVVDMYGDMMFVSAAVETALRHAGGTGATRSTFQYLFSHQPRSSNLARSFPWFRGASHSDELNFVFNMNLRDPAELRLARAISDAWTNFAKFGTPNEPQSQASFQWPAYNLDTKAYTNLDLVITSERDIFSQRMGFWLSLVPPVTTQSSSTATQNASHLSQTYSATATQNASHLSQTYSVTATQNASHLSQTYSAAETASNAAGHVSEADHTHLRTLIVVLYVLAFTCWQGL